MRNSLLFHGNCSVGLCFISDIYILFFFFLSSPGWRLINFIDLYKESAFGFIDFLYWFPVFDFMDFCSISFYYFFSSACFGFHLLFLILLFSPIFVHRIMDSELWLLKCNTHVTNFTKCIPLFIQSVSSAGKTTEEEDAVMDVGATWIAASDGHSFSGLPVQHLRLWQPFTVERHLVSNAGNQDLSVVLLLAPCSFLLHKPLKQEVYGNSFPRNACKQE